ncbi:MAG: PAS domain S-box protein [Chloroflexi bacterium]|nr:PAS domain S-box protein [Chloroflexota bacterium]
MKNIETARILIVEDEAIEAMDLQNRLVNLGYPPPDIVHSGEDAVRKAKETNPDLVLMDIMLPGEIDGITAAEQIRTFLDVPIIFVTAYADAVTLQRAKITEPYAYIVKPYQENELHIAIDMALYKHSAEKRLGESGKLVDDLFNFAPVGYFILDIRGTISNANFTASHMLGVPRDKMINAPFTNFVDLQHRNTFLSYLEEIARTGQISSAEIEMRKSDGNKFYAQLQSVILYQRPNTNYRVSVADITDRKLVEKALNESEKKYHDLAEFFPEPVFETDVRGKVTYANQRALASFKLSLEDMRKGINVFDLIVPGDKASALENFARVLERGDIGANEYTLIRRDGATFQGLTHTARITREDKVTGIRGILLDITERKKNEQALKESERRFRTTLDNMLEGCIIVDFNWRYLYANDAAARLTGIPKEARMGKTVMEVIPGIEKQEVWAHVKRCLEDRVADHYESQITLPDGRQVWFEQRAEPVPEGMLLMYTDINDRKLAEQRIKNDLERIERIYSFTQIASVKPVGLLMIEHRLIERVIALLVREKTRIEQADKPDSHFIDYVVDFFRTYADKTHHGKEEEVLFKALAPKPLTPEHRKTMDELIREHVLARKLVTDLVEAKERWVAGDADARGKLITAVAGLIELYPAHIEKEDKLFFLPAMEYFSPQELDDMLLECWDYDRQIVHWRYTEGLETLTGTQATTNKVLGQPQ